MDNSLEGQSQASAGVAERVFTKAEPLPPPAATYTISARGKDPHAPVFAFLRNQYGNVPLREIGSLFGFVERSTLYGGRAFTQRELSARDVFQLNGAGIGVRLPMSNHSVECDEYERNLALLEKYHRPGNSVIVTNDDLARWIQMDFPDYHIDASVIKNIKTHRKINEVLKLYDSVVLPMRLNEDFDFLEKVEAKDGGFSTATIHRSRVSPLQAAAGPSRHIDRFLGLEILNLCRYPLVSGRPWEKMKLPLGMIAATVPAHWQHVSLQRGRKRSDHAQKLRRGNLPQDAVPGFAASEL